MCTGAIESAAALCVHYLDSFERGRVTLRDALGPAAPKKQSREFSFRLRLSSTLLSLPLTSSNLPEGKYDESSLVVSLESFVLSGSITNVVVPTTMAPKISDIPQRLLGSSQFSSLQIRFRPGYLLFVRCLPLLFFFFIYPFELAQKFCEPTPESTSAYYFIYCFILYIFPFWK